jgi:uncharacterized protein (DUF2141 family)
VDGPWCAAAAVWLALAPSQLRAAEAAQCQPDHPKINVVVEGVRSDRGDVLIELYPDDSKRFANGSFRMAQARVAARPEVSACLPAPSAGFYAVAVYHDENRDDVFNRNALGLPSEGFGLSNNPQILLGRPPFKALRFQIGEGETTIRIKLHYLGGSGRR